MDARDRYDALAKTKHHLEDALHRMQPTAYIDEENQIRLKITEAIDLCAKAMTKVSREESEAT